LLLTRLFKFFSDRLLLGWRSRRVALGQEIVNCLQLSFVLVNLSHRDIFSGVGLKEVHLQAELRVIFCSCVHGYERQGKQLFLSEVPTEGTENLSKYIDCTGILARWVKTLESFFI
jgi:hypothetical protein